MKKSDMIKWNGDMTEPKDFAALVLKVKWMLKNNTKMPAFKSKSKTLSITCYKTKIKTLQFQGADANDFKTYVKDLVEECAGGMQKNRRNQAEPLSVTKSVEKKSKSKSSKSL